MSYKLFLDDFRVPEDCVSYMHQRIGAKNPVYIEPGWKIAKNYDDFTRIIKECGVPSFVSFDHDLAEEHYTPEVYWDDYNKSKQYQESKHYTEKTGYECAKWLVEYCIENKVKFPAYAVHSMNPVGADNIKQYIQSYLINQQ